MSATGSFGLSNGGPSRQPVTLTATVTGSGAATAGSNDVVGHALAATFAGDFTGITGSNAGSAWGFNMFTTTGSTTGDAKGLTTLYGGLVEASIQSPPDVTISTVVGFMAEAAFFGASAGATVGRMQSMRVGAPKRKDGATGGVAGTVFGLYVENTQAAPLGASAAFAVFVEGGVSRFGGRVDVTDQIANAGSGDLNIFAGFAQTDGARLQLSKVANGGHAYVRLATPAAEFGVHDGTVATFSVGRTGLPKWNAAGNAQATVGAAGSASPPPATPAKYLKVVDSTGTVLVIPAYAAS